MRKEQEIIRKSGESIGLSQDDLHQFLCHRRVTDFIFQKLDRTTHRCQGILYLVSDTSRHLAYCSQLVHPLYMRFHPLESCQVLKNEQVAYDSSVWPRQ